MTRKEYFNGNSLAEDVWLNKYALRDSSGKLLEETPDDMHRRLAKEFARIEAKYPNPMSEEEIYSLLERFKYIIPQGSPMFGIGNDHQTVSLSNCFVVGNEHDSYGGIIHTDQEQVHLMKRRGGVGHDLSHIRPAGTPVNNSAMTSTGVVPFMERYSNSTREVAQGGRRGALMLSIDVNHQDAEAFIDAKLEQGKITGANISVRVDDGFMKAIDDPLSRESKLWGKIVHNAWKSAEPGVLFWDTIIRESIPSCYGDRWVEKSTNPCGEIPLCPYDSCRLLAVNLYSYVVHPFTHLATFNYKLFYEHVQKAQRLMDDLVDLEIEKIDKILDKVKSDKEPDHIKEVEIRLWEKIRSKAVNGRRTGLGITGAGDMLAALGYRYGSEEGTYMLEDVIEEFKFAAYESSIAMAEERGSFPIFNAAAEKNNPFIDRLHRGGLIVDKGRRNIALLTIAPTGSVSILTETTSGLESVFKVSYKRRKKINPSEEDKPDFIDQNGDAWKEYNVLHHHFITWYMTQAAGKEYTFAEAKAVLEKMSDDKIEGLIAQSPYAGAQSHEVDWEEKAKMQGIIQSHIDHSISVTVNMPETATEEDVDKVYRTAYQSGCKGITVYRDGSRSGVLVTKDSEPKISDNNAPKRPKRLAADVIEFQNNKEKWVAFIGLYHDRPYEIFVGRMQDILKEFPRTRKDVSIIKEYTDEGKKYYASYNGTKAEISNVFNKEYWNYAKFISSLLRHGVPMQYVYDIVRGMNMDDDSLNSWKSGVARILKKYIDNGVKSKEKCSSCGAEGTMHFVEGCETCKSCGTSKCS